MKALELPRMLSGANDRANCFMDINAGAGGTESMDWAAMLFRMYTRYCERQGLEGRAQRLRGRARRRASRTSRIRIAGEYAYGYLKAETGVHRLVRISPFDSNARRQTAFASVDVYPEIDDDIEIDIPETDVRAEVHPRRRAPAARR